MEESTSTPQHDERIILDLRGTKKTVYKSTIMLSGSPVLTGLIGEGTITSMNNVNKDGSIFIDCEEEDMTCLLGYLETGHIRLKNYDKKYFSKICEKFGVSFDHKPKNKSGKIKEGIEKLENVVQEYINQDSHRFGLSLLILRCPTDSHEQMYKISSEQTHKGPKNTCSYFWSILVPKFLEKELSVMSKVSKHYGILNLKTPPKIKDKFQVKSRLVRSPMNVKGEIGTIIKVSFKIKTK